MAQKDTRIHLPRMSVTAAMLGSVLGYQTATTETVCGKRRAVALCAQNAAHARQLFADKALCSSCISAYKVGLQFGAPPIIWPDDCKGK